MSKPSRVARRNSVRSPVEAIKVFDGTQSHSTAAPPTPSASTTVTLATERSRAAATNAASYPAGPPPRITMRVTAAQNSSTGRAAGSSETPSLTGAGVFVDDDMHGGFLSGGSAAVDADVVGKVIRSRIRRVDVERDQPACAHVANLIVDWLTIAISAITDSVAIPLIRHVGYLTGQSARQTFMGPRFPRRETPRPQFTWAFRG